MIETPSEKFYNRLQKKIDKAISENKPYDKYVRQQIKILEDYHDEFVASAERHGVNMNKPAIADFEIRQYSLMKALAEKIGLPAEKYDELIKNVKARIFGEENLNKLPEQK